MQYRVNFIVLVLMGLVYQGTGFVFIWVLLGRFQALGGWTFADIAFLYGFRLLVHALWGFLLGNLARVSWQVRRGEFDRYLTRPLAPLLQIASSTLELNRFGDLVGGVALFGVSINLVRIAWSPILAIYLGLALIGGILAESALTLAIAALSFRLVATDSIWYLVQSSFGNYGNYPLKIFSLGLQFFLTFVIPVAFVAYLPVSVLLGRASELGIDPIIAYLTPVMGAILFLLAHRFWQWQLRSYQSSGN
ncbi:MAG TPA: ABC-2 family transporter protein [Chloroflexota bacterium]|nr:ABC-2 family transporter protein [Chloroflexota bacterium]